MAMSAAKRAIKMLLADGMTLNGLDEITVKSLISATFTTDFE